MYSEIFLCILVGSNKNDYQSCPEYHETHFLPPANEVLGRLFLHMSVILLGGRGVVPFPLGLDTPWKEHGTRQEVTSYPTPVLISSGGHRSGRYASYWNAFFWFCNFLNPMKFCKSEPTNQANATDTVVRR